MTDMQVSRRRLLPGIAGLSVAIAVAIVAASPVYADSTLETARANGYIRVGFANEAPFGYATPEGKLTGEAPEVAKAIAAVGTATAGLPGPSLPLDRQALALIGHEMTVSDAKARKEIGYENVITIEEGLAELER